MSHLTAWCIANPIRWSELIAACKGDQDVAKQLWLEIYEDGLSDVHDERARIVELTRQAAALGDTDAVIGRLLDQVREGTTPDEALLQHVAAGPSGNATTYTRLIAARTQASQ